MKRRLLWWVPLLLAVLVGAGGHMLLIGPVQRDIGKLRLQLGALQAQQIQAEARITRDTRVEQVPLPISDSGLDRVWPGLAKDVETHGYTVQLLSFVPGISGRTRTLTLTLRLTGSYLAMNDTLITINKMIPLWSWRTLEVQSQTGTDVTVVATGVLPLTGAPVVGVGTAPTQPTQPGQQGPTPPPAPPSRQAPGGPRP